MKNQWALAFTESIELKMTRVGMLSITARQSIVSG